MSVFSTASSMPSLQRSVRPLPRLDLREDVGRCADCEALRLSTDQVITNFVNICVDCINIYHEGRWKSFKQSAKCILLDDGSFRASLHTLILSSRVS